MMGQYAFRSLLLCDQECALIGARLRCNHDTIRDAWTWRFCAAVVNHRQPARFDMELALRIKSNANTDRDERSVYSCA